MKVGIIMKNSMVEKIMELNRKIESITRKTTSYFSFGEKQNLNNYDRPDINKLAEVIDLAEENKHILITDFGYDRLVKFYDSVGDIKNREKYQKFYDNWKKKRETIEFQNGHIKYIDIKKVRKINGYYRKRNTS